jgi:hypothetical protein
VFALGFAGAAASDPPRTIEGFADLHFGVRAPETLRELAGSRVDLELCALREAGHSAGRSLEACERVTGRTHIGYLPFDVEVYYSKHSRRATRIRLALSDTEQWSARSYESVLRTLEASHGRAEPFLPLGKTFEGYCEEHLRLARLGTLGDLAALVPPRCSEAHRIEAPGGRITISRCVRERCPGAALLLPVSTGGLVGMRSLDVEVQAALAPGESGH